MGSQAFGVVTAITIFHLAHSDFLIKKRVKWTLKQQKPRVKANVFGYRKA